MGERFADSQSRAALWAGALFSVGAHLVVGVIVAGHPGLGRGDGAEQRADEPRARLFEPPAFRLGEDRGDATAIAWLGYDEYRRHVAEPWLQDQAAFTPSASVPSPLPPAAEPVPPAPESRPERVAEAAAEAFEQSSPQESLPSDPPSPQPVSPAMPAVDPAEVAGAVRAAADRARDLVASTIAAVGEAGQSLIPPRPERVRAVAEVEEQAGEPIEEAAEAEEVVTPTEVALEESAERLAERPGKEMQEQSAEPAQRSAERSPGSGLPGEVQDREAIAASIERATLVEWGQPLAAAGLRVATVRPRHITPLTRATTRPRDPVVRVHFGRDGRVREASLLRSSGHRNIDQPILDAVYQWTASGKPLADLDAANNHATLVVDFRIAL